MNERGTVWRIIVYLKSNQSYLVFIEDESYIRHIMIAIILDW